MRPKIPPGKNLTGPSGSRLRALRLTLGITTRDVQSYSRIIARSQENRGYYISHSSLIDIENSFRTPSVFKLFTLSVIYRINFVDLLLFFGIDLEQISQGQLAVKLPKTHIIPSEIYDAERRVSFPVRFDPGARIQETSILSRMVQTWGEIPIAFVQHLGIQEYLYGFIGLDDHTLEPMIRPGAFVQIDDQDDKIESESWDNEFERPIYFFQLRDGYAYGWCRLDDKVVSIIPHSLSRAEIRQFSYPNDIDIVGRVVAVATPLLRKRGRSSSPVLADRRVQ